MNQQAHTPRRYVTAEPPNFFRWAGIAVLALAVTHFIAFCTGGELRQRQLEADVRADRRIAEGKQISTPAYEFCTSESVGRAKSHVSSCYTREISRRFGP